jgi:hypothetical protein
MTMTGSRPMFYMTTLWDAALKAERGRPLEMRMTKGGLGNGRAEKRLGVCGLISGCVALQQGLTADWIFVGRERARDIEVEFENA